MTTNHPAPPDGIANGYNLNTGEMDWAAFFEANPSLNPPGYDETVARLGYSRKQVVNTPKPMTKYSPDTAMEMVKENQKIRAERELLHGKTPPDHFKQPTVKH